MKANLKRTSVVAIRIERIEGDNWHTFESCSCLEVRNADFWTQRPFESHSVRRRDPVMARENWHIGSCVPVTRARTQAEGWLLRALSLFLHPAISAAL